MPILQSKPNTGASEAGVLYGFDPGNPSLVNAVRVTVDGKLLVDGITGGGGGGGSTIDREFVVTTYIVKTAFTNASIGDIVTATQIIDVTGSPITVTTLWRNQTTGFDFLSVPNPTNLDILASQALTDAQLRAAAVVVSPNVTRGSGIIDSNTQRMTFAINDQLAAGTREYNTPVRQAVGSSSATIAIPTLGLTREVYIMSNTSLFFLTGNNLVAAASNTSHPLNASERFHFKIPTGHTHIAFIRDSVDGFVTIASVA